MQAQGATANSVDSPSRPGRRRDPEVRGRILAATRELLCESGYADLKVIQVAARAGVSRPSMYRWWRSKGQLVHEAVFEDLPPLPAVDEGSLESDLRSLVKHLVRGLNRPEVVAYFRGVAATSANREADDSTTTLLSKRIKVARERYAEVVTRAAARGEIADDCDADALYWAIYGGVQTRLLLGAPISTRRLEEKFYAVALALVTADHVRTSRRA